MARTFADLCFYMEDNSIPKSSQIFLEKKKKCPLGLTNNSKCKFPMVASGNDLHMMGVFMAFPHRTPHLVKKRLHHRWTTAAPRKKVQLWAPWWHRIWRRQITPLVLTKNMALRMYSGYIVANSYLIAANSGHLEDGTGILMDIPLVMIHIWVTGKIHHMFQGKLTNFQLGHFP